MGVLLANQTLESVDIRTEAEVLRFTYVDAVPALFAARLVVGSVGSYGVTGGTYYPTIWINDLELLPSYPLTVPAGATGFIVNTRANIMLPNDVISLRLLGQSGDSAVRIVGTIYDTESMSESDIQRIAEVVGGSLGKLEVRPERVILGPTKPCVKTFLLPK